MNICKTCGQVIKQNIEYGRKPHKVKTMWNSLEEDKYIIKKTTKERRS